MKRIWKRTLALLLVLCTLLSTMSLSAFALSWDGSSSGGGGGGSPATVKGFSIRYTTEENCIGYRFAVVDSSGSTKNGKTIDVFRSTYYGNYEYTNAYKFNTKYNKKQLIGVQNGSFSTSKTSNNCFQESGMGFSTTLPGPSGMGTWQANNANLNAVLSKLGAGSVTTLIYGDKVLVEPIYDVELEGTHHAVTVTELALYGKHLLGANSDGGASSSSGSWGFISGYTNKHYPNWLFTPDGQGLWTAATSLSKRATFYTIINSGYGVGIAFTQNTNTSYTIKFNGNGATGGSTAQMSMTYGTAKNLTANGFTRTGHAFKNWNTKSDGTGTSYSDKQSVNNLTSTNGGTVNLYAQWTPYNVLVCYNANGGALNSTTYSLISNWVSKDNAYFFDKWEYDKTYANGLYDATTFGLHRTGYTFNQWGSSATGGTIYRQDDATLKASILNPDVVNGSCYKYLYAQWKPITYTIVFNSNGGSGTMSNLAMTYDVSKNLTSNSFTKSNYHFLGWNTKADGTGTGYANQQSVKNLSSTQGATITLYAQWAVSSYTIAFDGNGATSGITSTMTMNFGQTKNLNANGYSRTGYIFSGWNRRTDGTGTAYTNQQSVKDLTAINGATVTLYAQWTPKTYTIRFMPNTGSGTMDPMSMTYDVSQNLTANAFTKTGYHFTGWNTRADGAGNSYSNQQSVMNLTSVNGGIVYLYAQWEPNTYYVYFRGNGSTSGSMSSQRFVYDREQSLRANAFEREHYTFKGWNRNILGTGTSYTDEEAVKNLTTVNNGIIYLYAQWEYDPDLGVNTCEVVNGANVGTGFHLGISSGSTFSDYSYTTGYPMLDKELWYIITFPKEQVDTRVKQSVWINDDKVESRIVYSNSNTSYRVKLNPSKVTENDVYFYVKAREDYVDASGNVLKYGTAKTFYIPIRPTVHRPSVTLYNFFGGAASVATPESATAPVYVGQKIMVAYGYTSDNAWYSSNLLTGTMYSWQDGRWKIVNGSADYSATRTLSKAAVARGYSTLGYYRVPDNSGAPSGNNMMFSLTSRWASDMARTLETTTIYNPIVKSDIAITSIRLISENGYVLDSNHLQAGQNVKVMYTYKNNTNCTVYVQGYQDDKSEISGIYAISPNSSINVYGHSFTVPNQRTISLWGGVYLEGAGIYNTEWESNGSNNAMTTTFHVDHPLTLIPIEPNAAYRESTEVISSFWLINNYTEDYTPSKNETVRFRVYKADGTLIKTVTKSQVVVPASDRNLLYFKWTVPTGLGGNLTIKADILENGNYYNVATKTYDTVSYTMYQTPDTQFEKNKPSGFNIPGEPAKSTNYATWYEYSYSGGAFVKTVYGLGLVGKTDTIAPATGETAVYEGGKWTMKSGYGISVKSSTLLTTGVAGYSYAKSDAYTNPQYFRALYPEYSYKNATGCCTTLVRNGSYAELPTFMTYGKVHFTPLWFPNGNYTVSILASDCWTPAGMLTVKSVSNTITIDGSAYDDFYVGH